MMRPILSFAEVPLTMAVDVLYRTCQLIADHAPCSAFWQPCESP